MEIRTTRRAYRRAAPLLLSILGIAGTCALSRALAERDEMQLSRVVASVSYSTRSELARRLEAQQRSLRDLARFWGSLDDARNPAWQSQVEAQDGLLSGMELLAWSDPERGIRRFSIPDGFDPARRATEAEWRSIRGSLERVTRTAEASMEGPIVLGQGRVIHRIYVPVRQHDGRQGVLIAQFGTARALADLLHDEAPGYAIRVTWDGHEIYRRGEADADLPSTWIQEGAIRLPFGGLWRVRHAPTRELRRDLAGTGALLVGASGTLISLLLGMLAFEGLRARDRARVARAAESRVSQLNRELEERVARRTAQLEQAMADLESFNSFVSHDLKSPFGAILTFVSLLREDATELMDERSVGHLARIESSAHSGLARIQGLLALARISERGLRCERIDLTGLVLDVFEEMRLQAAVPTASLELGRLPPAQGDAELLRTVFSNLIGNALKFAGGTRAPHIEVAGETREGEIILQVRDNGPGFDGRFGERLFRPFVRLHPDETEGHGLGLAIVERVVRRHGGRVWAEGSPGVGATFFVALPDSAGPARGSVFARPPIRSNAHLAVHAAS